MKQASMYLVLVLMLAGACVADGDSGDDGTGSTGSGDDGGTDGGDGTGGDDGTGDGGGTGGDGGGTGGTDGTGGTSGTGGEGIQCGTEPVTFPEFDKSCVGNEDCALVFHTISCCGTDVAWGINVDEVPAFDAAEAICDSQFPGCGCPAGPTEAEDGNTGMSPDDFAVTCDAGTCMSYVP